MACLVVLIGLSTAAQRPSRIGLIDAHIDRAEMTAIREGIRNMKGASLRTLTPTMIQSSQVLRGITHLWYHRTDTAAFDKDEKMMGEAIKRYVREGGNLFLSMEAAALLNEWGIETSKFELRRDTLHDEGFGRPAGFHSFKSHPLFHGLNGGVYSTKQKQDHVVRLHGFFGNNLPQKGKVVGIKWTYITFTEDSKLLLEYSYGKGHIIVAGAYLYYAADNYNRPHLWQFTSNVFRYMAGELKGEKANYWQYEHRSFQAQQFSIPAIPPQKAIKWSLPAPTLQLKQPVATRDFYDLVGRRILWMGKMNGGVDEIWMHPYMALRDLHLGVTMVGTDSVSWLEHVPASVEVTPEYLARTYRLGKTTLREIYTVSFDAPSGVLHIEIDGHDIRSLNLSYASNLRYMWPYSEKATGSIQYSYDSSINGHVISGQNGSLNTMVAYSERPLHQSIKADEAKQEIRVGAQFALNHSQAINVYITGSSTNLKEAVDLYRNKRNQMNRLAEVSQHYYQELLRNHLYFTTPDTLFNTGYRWALARTDQFLQTTPGLGTSLMAGFGTTARGWNGNQPISGRPGYAWYFGRDAQWSAMAINDYGDYPMVKKVLETFIQFQDVNGKIYHELSSSGAAHYDAADATPLFLILAAQYLRNSGDTVFLRQHWPAIQKALDFCYATDTDGDGLIENTNVGHGWIEGGALFGTHTEFYLAGCWAAALESVAYIKEQLSLPGSDILLKEASSVKQSIDKFFWNDSQHFFHNGKMQDGSFMPDATVLAAVPLYLDAIVDRRKAEVVASRLGNSQFSTDWGIRIIEDSSNKYRPGSYHAGMVWPLYGGWAALAEYKTGFGNSGYRHIMNNLLQYRHWAAGSIEETLNGDTYRPNGVCSHQAWSETMVLQPAIEGMLGFNADVMKNRLSLSPAFPWHWEFCTAHNIRMGKSKFQLEMKRDTKGVTYVISAERATTLIFTPVFPLHSQLREASFNGMKLDPVAENRGATVILPMTLSLRPGKNEIRLNISGGIGLLPIVADPQPGDSSTGVNIISEVIAGNKYKAVLSGRPGRTYEVKLYHQDQAGEIAGARLMKNDGNISTLSFQLPASNKAYAEQTIEVTLP